MPMGEVRSATPFCIQCGYNLTRLSSDRCPECGWQIDWALAVQVAEARLRGTPAHRAQGWRVIDQTLLTVLIMLFLPWRFARQVQPGERLAPALSVAVVSYLITFVPHRLTGTTGVLESIVFAVTISTVILCQTVCCATLYRSREPRYFTWDQRFRLWLIVLLYATCFVSVWNLTGPPVVALDGGNVYIPLQNRAGLLSLEWGASIIFYWWWVILGVVIFIRTRPRWLAALCTLSVFVVACIGTQTYLALGEWL